MTILLNHQQEAAHSTSQSLKVNLYFPVIDHILSEMGRRFSERNLGIMTSVQTCDPTSSHFLEESELKPMASHYGLDDDLDNECQLAHRSLSGQNLETTMDVYRNLLPLQAAFPTLIKLYQIALTLAVSTAQCERTFSALKRIKTYLRTTMSEQTLADMSLLSIEKDLSKEIDFEEVIKRFENGDKNRSIILS